MVVFDMEALILLEILLAIIPVGFIAALMGIGGGVLIIPILTAFFHIGIKEAIAVSIVTVVATSITGGSRYLKQGIANVRLGVFLELSTALGAIVGAFATILAPPYVLYLILSVLLFYLSFVQITTSKVEAEKIKHKGFARVEEDGVARALQLSGKYYDTAEGKDVVYRVTGTFKGLVASLVAGICSGMLGIGGGVLKVPVMNQLMNIPMKVAIATSKFMISITASTGAIIYILLGFVNFELMAPTALGVIIGALLGTMVMNRVKAEKLKILFGLLLIYFAYLMLAKGLYAILGVRLPGV
ncbi:MAG: sulfite exporter TauE/SafE family protein [Thermoprotei archaeon]|nr:MAG: sulfite exporter TauE/SafE family protein [Thermoprotei archaeon]